MNKKHKIIFLALSAFLCGSEVVYCIENIFTIHNYGLAIIEGALAIGLALLASAIGKDLLK